MAKHPAVLFPHVTITGAQLNLMRSRFDALIICQPWFMDAFARSTGDDDPPFISILRPPEKMKPGEDFLLLFSEYRAWMAQNSDKGYAFFLKSAGHDEPPEETTWGIRGLLRGKEGKYPTGAEEERILKWHLILHLAKEVEIQHGEVEEMLERAKSAPPPLAEALGEETPKKGPLEDLPASETSPFLEEEHLRAVAAAWFGLFGQLTRDQKVFVTLDAYLFRYVRDIFEEACGPLSADDQGGNRGELNADGESYRLTLPALSQGPAPREEPMLEGLSGKTLILVKKR